jgi:hypothetical protein
VVATAGNQRQIKGAQKRRKQAKSVAVGCHGLPESFHGKEGSAVRVRQRALQRPCKTGFLCQPYLQNVACGPGMASMGTRGDAYDNAACESCIATLKEEWIKRHRYTSRDQARLSSFSYIETFYNPRRRHSSLGGISPDEYERRFPERLKREEIHPLERSRAA